jgi:hypothetical protein
MILTRGIPHKHLVALFIFLVVTVLYLFTLAPSITERHIGADGAELAASAYTLGVAHPTGYPTYLILAKIFSLVIPWGDIAHRVNILSAISGAGAVTLVYLTCHMFIERTFRASEIISSRASASAIIAAAALAFSPILWSQSIKAEVYSLNALFTGGVIFLTLLWSEKPGAGFRPLFAATLLLGLGLGNHLTLVFTGLPLAYVMATHRREFTPRAIATLLGAFLLGLSVYAYLPIRASENPPINWGDASTLEGFLWTVTAVPYRGLAFGLPLAHMPARLLEWADILAQQFNALGLLLGIIGVWRLRISRLPLLVFCALLFLPSIVFSFMYLSGGASVYMIPAFMVLALWIGVGFYWISDITIITLAPRLKSLFPLPQTLFLVALLMVPGLSFSLNYEGINLREDNESLAYVQGLFKVMEPNSVILADTDYELFPLWYYSLVEERDKGTTVISTRLTQFDWYVRGQSERYPDIVPTELTTDYTNRLIQIVEFNIGKRPVYITSAADFLLAHFYGSPEGDIYRLLSRKKPQ